MLEFTSDASTSVMKNLRDLKATSEGCLADLLLSLDVWHKGKNLRKALTKVAATKQNAILKEWISPIVNHLWYSSRTCGGSVDKLKV